MTMLNLVRNVAAKAGGPIKIIPSFPSSKLIRCLAQAMQQLIGLIGIGPRGDGSFMQRTEANLFDRMARAAKLDTDLYEEVERDTGATSQALLVVVIVAIATGIGGLLAGVTQGTTGGAITGFLVGIIAGVVGWGIWSFLTYFVGTKLLGGTADWGEMLRTIGFAYTPNVLGIFAFVPLIGWLIVLIGGIWALIAGVIAVRQALDFSTGRAVLTVLIGWLAMVVVTALLGIFGLGI
jgi:hypothetical protein